MTGGAVIKKSKVKPGDARPISQEAQQTADPSAGAPQETLDAGTCGGEVKASVHPQPDGTCVIEVTCSCGNVIQVQCITG
jgi:hypothetical protein